MTLKNLSELRPITEKWHIPPDPRDLRSLLDVTELVAPGGILHVADLQEVTPNPLPPASCATWGLGSLYRGPGASLWRLGYEEKGGRTRRVLQRIDRPAED